VGWWLERPLWIAASALILAGLVRIFARFEHPKRLARSQPGSVAPVPG
jgi:hypothetical protein